MKSTSNLKPFKTFASEQTQYIETQDAYESNPNFERGFEPLETLPATWHNTILQMLTKQAEETYKTVTNILEELVNAIGEEFLDPTTVDNLKNKLAAIRPPIASATEPGIISTGHTNADETEAALRVDTAGNGYVKLPLASATAGLAKSGSGVWKVSFADGVGTVTPDTDVQLSFDATTNTLSIKCNGVSKSVTLPAADANYATCATYLIPSKTSTERAIYAETSGNLRATTLQLG